MWCLESSIKRKKENAKQKYKNGVTIVLIYRGNASLFGIKTKGEMIKAAERAAFLHTQKERSSNKNMKDRRFAGWREDTKSLRSYINAQ